MKNYNLNNRVIPLFMIFIIIVIIVMYSNLILDISRRVKFARQGNTLFEINKNEVFSIEKVLLCSSANAVDKSENDNLKSLDIYQYTDIAIYIKNGDELTNTNTVKQLYIDNINIDSYGLLSNTSLNYKNILDFGLNHVIDKEPIKNEVIHFNILRTNEENNNADYSTPVFYTDCSNPITLQYVNYNIMQNYQMEPNNAISFNGSLLQNAGIKIEQINCKIKFRINIINNNQEYYSYWLTIKLPLDDIYKGTSMKTKNLFRDKGIFFRC